MDLALWIVAGLLAFAFAGAGITKLMSSKEDLQEKMPWVGDVSQAQVQGIGAIELLGAIGLILPPLVDVAPILAPLAAAGLTLTMLGAVFVHLRRGDGFANALPAIILGGMAAFVAVMRFGSQSF